MKLFSSKCRAPERDDDIVCSSWKHEANRAAKTGYLNSFDNYSEINKRVSKATGGKTGRMPFFFQFSKNGRKEPKNEKKGKKNCAKPTRSTMNRLCERFMHIGNINFNYADVKPFNWAMMLAADDKEYNPEAVQIFCELDNAILGENIEFQTEYVEFKRRSLHEARCEYMRCEIVDEMTRRFGSLENTYPSVVKYLFAGDNLVKQSHKQMFWRVYGDMACGILRENMQRYSVCPRCGMKLPPWSHKHDCPKNASGFFECVDCGKFCRRTNSKQCRCEECQTAHRKQNQNRLHKKYYRSSKE